MLFEKKGMSKLNYYLILRFDSCLDEFRFNYVIPRYVWDFCDMCFGSTFVVAL